MNSFNPKRYKSILETSWLGADLIYKKSVGSTNSELKNLTPEQLGHGTLCIADYQTGGRGQYKRSWNSEKNKNLMFTMGFKPSSGDRLPLLTLSCALGVARAIDQTGIKGCEIKWPNDVLINGKKVAGVLTETVFIGKQPERVLVGIGMNVNQTEFGKEVGAEATSIALEKDERIRREDLLCVVLRQIEHLYTRWHQRDQDLCKEVNDRLIGFGQWVSASLNGTIKEEKYKFLGMNDRGQCVMLNEDLNVHTFSYEQIRVIPGR